SSRTLNGFDPLSIESSLAQTLGRPLRLYNFGIPGAGPFRQLLQLRRFQTAGFRPDLLLLEVLPMGLLETEQLHDAAEHSLTVAKLGRNDRGLAARYGGRELPRLRRDWWEAALFPCHAQRLAILSAAVPWLLPDHLRLSLLRDIDERGFLPFLEPLADRR